MNRRSHYSPAMRTRERRTWTDLPGKPQRYLHARRRGLRRFAGVLLVLAVALCALAVFA